MINGLCRAGLNLNAWYPHGDREFKKIGILQDIFCLTLDKYLSEFLTIYRLGYATSLLAAAEKEEGQQGEGGE
jgi:hypothetical protein